MPRRRNSIPDCLDIWKDPRALPAHERRELEDMFLVNSPSCEDQWFDADTENVMMHELDEVEFFETYMMD